MNKADAKATDASIRDLVATLREQGVTNEELLQILGGDVQ